MRMIIVSKVTLLIRNINRNKFIFFRMKKILKRLFLEEKLTMLRKRPNHPELKKKIKLLKPTADNNTIKVDIYDKKVEINQFQFFIFEKKTEKTSS